MVMSSTSRYKYNWNSLNILTISYCIFGVLIKGSAINLSLLIFLRIWFLQGSTNSGFWFWFFGVALGGVYAELSSLNIYEYDVVIEYKIHNIDWNDNFTYIWCETMYSVSDKTASKPVTYWQIKRLL